MQVIKNKTIIFIASVPWQYNWQRQHEWASRLAQNNKVLYVQPLGMNNIGPFKLIKKLLERKQKGIYQHALSAQAKSNLTFLNPFFIPWHNHALITRFNGWLLARQIQKQILTPKAQLIFWICNPTDTINSILRLYPQATTIYDIAMRFLMRPDCPRYLKKSQDRLALRADLILTDSKASATDLPREVQDKINYVPQGVNKKNLKPGQRYQPKLKKIRGQKIIYLGARHDSIDSTIFQEILRGVPRAQIILTYDRGPDDLSDSHLHYIGPVQFSEIPNLLQEVDLGLIPYKINQYTYGVFPTKFFEYLAAGLPVVSTALPELNQFADKIMIAKSPAEFPELIKRALKKPHRQVDLDFIEQQTWESRFMSVTRELIKVLGAHQS